MSIPWSERGGTIANSNGTETRVKQHTTNHLIAKTRSETFCCCTHCSLADILVLGRPSHCLLCCLVDAPARATVVTVDLGRRGLE